MRRVKITVGQDSFGTWRVFYNGRCYGDNQGYTSREAAITGFKAQYRSWTQEELDAEYHVQF